MLFFLVQAVQVVQAVQAVEPSVAVERSEAIERIEQFFMSSSTPSLQYSASLLLVATSAGNGLEID
jgi:hypothetical protein